MKIIHAWQEREALQEIESDIYDRMQITEYDGGNGGLEDHPHPPSNPPFPLSSSVNPPLHTADGCSRYMIQYEGDCLYLRL